MLFPIPCIKPMLKALQFLYNNEKALNHYAASESIFMRQWVKTMTEKASLPLLSTYSAQIM
jgi:hypothetical protein